MLTSWCASAARRLLAATLAWAGITITAMVCGAYVMADDFHYLPDLHSLLLGGGIVEGCRMALAALLLRAHQPENLATL